jgi:hypothetical protein
MSNSNSPAQGIQWGSSAIGGAMNATELAAWLSGQGNVGVEDAAKSAAATPSGTASALSMKPGSSVSQTSSPVRTATKTTSKRTAPQATVADSIEYTAQEILDILSEATGFNGAALSRSLSNGTHAAYLSQFTPSAGGAGKISSRGNVMSRSSGTSSRTPKAPVGGGKASVADSVEVDIDSTISEKSNGWGGRNIGGARNASELAAWLAQNGQVGVQGQADSGGNEGPNNHGIRPWNPGASEPNYGRRVTTNYIESGKKYVPRPPKPDNYVPPASKNVTGAVRSRPPVAPTRYGAMSNRGQTVADSVEVDIDSIIAEGVERYGEEVFLDIIADFDATGEMSQELFDLLG